MKVVFVVLLAAAAALGLPSRNVDPALSWRVIGGETAPDAEYPYMVSIRSSSGHRCGGSITKDLWILTAAHCIIGLRPSDLTVIVGSHRLNMGGVAHSVDKLIYHNDYDEDLIQNDIGLIKLNEKIILNNHTAVITLGNENTLGGVNCILTGWGSTSYPGTAPNDLQFIELKTLTVEDCKVRQSPNPIIASQLCTLTKKGEGACHGDSGGPLVANNKQIGIVSWGHPCALGYPDVFTRVQSFNAWINDIIAKN